MSEILARYKQSIKELYREQPFNVRKANDIAYQFRGIDEAFIARLRTIQPKEDKTGNAAIAINLSQYEGSIKIYGIGPEPNNIGCWDMKSGTLIYISTDTTQKEEPYNAMNPITYIGHSWDRLDNKAIYQVNDDFKIGTYLLRGHNWGYCNGKDIVEGYRCANYYHRCINVTLRCSTENLKEIVDFCLDYSLYAYPDDIRNALIKDIHDFVENEIKLISSYC